MFKTVLFPIDMSSESQHAIAKVAELVKYHDSRLVLLSVVEASEDPPGQASSGKPLPKRWPNCWGRRESNSLPPSPLRPKSSNAKGQPAFVICDVADETQRRPDYYGLPRRRPD